MTSEGKSKFVKNNDFQKPTNMLQHIVKHVDPLSEASSRLHGYATTVEGMDIYDLIVIDCMDILRFSQKHRYLNQKLITRRNGRSRRKYLL